MTDPAITKAALDALAIKLDHLATDLTTDEKALLGGVFALAYDTVGGARRSGRSSALLSAVAAVAAAAGGVVGATVPVGHAGQAPPAAVVDHGTAESIGDQVKAAFHPGAVDFTTIAEGSIKLDP